GQPHGVRPERGRMLVVQRAHQIGLAVQPVLLETRRCPSAHFPRPDRNRAAATSSTTPPTTARTSATAARIPCASHSISLIPKRPTVLDITNAPNVAAPKPIAPRTGSQWCQISITTPIARPPTTLRRN